jgi:hypothetical protein
MAAELGPWEEFTGGRERAAREREEWKDGIVAWLGTSRGSSWRRSGKQEVAGELQEDSTQELACWRKKQRGIL